MSTLYHFAAAAAAAGLLLVLLLGRSMAFSTVDIDSPKAYRTFRCMLPLCQFLLQKYLKYF
jgi:hypothetical protein